MKRALLAALAVVLLAYFLVRPPAISTGGIDFTAFYCASRVLSTGADPYAYEPLHTCEHASHRWRSANAVVAAPLPPYALVLLAPVARLPYPQAAAVWFLLLMASAATIIWAILELTALPLLIVGGSISIAVLLQSLPTGALAPIPLALLCAAAVMLTKGRWTITAILLGLACVEPHVALPALLAATALVPEMRVRGAFVIAALGAASLAAGFALNVEYFARVLPQHAVFELGSIVQFGLSSMLHNFGVSNRAAIRIGAAQYACFVGLGIYVANLFRRRYPSAVVLAPMAFAVTGGVYVHLTQIAAVLPLGFLVASRCRSMVPWVGIILLTVPWNLLNALGRYPLQVPPFASVVANALAHQSSPGSIAYLANALVYTGIACVLLNAATGLRRDARTGRAVV